MTTPFLEQAAPESVGLDRRQWDVILQTAEELCRFRSLPAISIEVQRRGLTTGAQAIGSRRLGSPDPIDSETLFLIASLTKPMLAMGILLLVERGELALNQRVSEFLPQFDGGAKRTVTIRHLLTHTSGLPDMLPNNQELRMAQAPLEVFADETCGIELMSPPGRTAVYQSMGYALLGRIIEIASRQPYGTFLRQHLFEPLGMTRTWLGLPEEMVDSPDIAEVQVPDEQADGVDWNWNSRYWRMMGAPWGGVVASIGDVSRFCRCMLTHGLTPSGERLFSPWSIQQATTNRLQEFSSIPEAERRTRGWGYGWRMNWKDHWSCFADLLPEETYGHWGATGTLCWLDARRETAAVILTTQPIGRDVAPHVRLSNMIAAAFTE